MSLWIPRTKEQLVQWLITYYPNDTAKFKRMKKRQLYKIHFEVKKKLKQEELCQV